RRGPRPQHPLRVVPHRTRRPPARLQPQRLLQRRPRRARTDCNEVVVRLLALALTLLALPAVLQAQDTGWQIDSIHVDYVINPDRTIDVTEWIVVDFGPLAKHGIYREINTLY